MTVGTVTPSTAAAPATTGRVPSRVARGILAAAVVAAGLGGFLATDAAAAARAVAAAGPDLTRLLRAMAAIKAMMGVGAAAAVVWRLSLPVSAPRLALYSAACAAMAAGPALIWNMADVGVGALLLHAGLIVTAVLLWRDPAVGRRLAGLIAERRAALAAAARDRG